MNSHDHQQHAEIEALVVASQRGESDAFAKLYDRFVNPVYRYVYYRVGEREAEDLTELIFLKIWENIRQYRAAPSFSMSLGSGRKARQKSFSSWIFRIAHNVVIDHYRSNRSADELKEEIQDHRPEANSALRAELHFNQEILASAMKHLKDHYRQILILKYINDLSNEEIGYIIGRSQAAIRILQYRALKSLKRIIENMGISDLTA